MFSYSKCSANKKKLFNKDKLTRRLISESDFRPPEITHSMIIYYNQKEWESN